MGMPNTQPDSTYAVLQVSIVLVKFKQGMAILERPVRENEATPGQQNLFADDELLLKPQLNYGKSKTK